MIKILILIAIVALITVLGVLLSANKKRRMQIYAELYEFNEQLLLSLKFNRSPISKIAQSFKFVSAIIEGNIPLSGNDAIFLKDYINNLGATDAQSQVDYLNERKTVIKKLMEESSAEYKKYSSLYIKIFFLIGVMAAVLMA